MAQKTVAVQPEKNQHGQNRKDKKKITLNDFSFRNFYLFRRCSDDSENFVELIEDVSNSREARTAVQHLDEDAADPPDVEGSGVVRRAELESVLNLIETFASIV